MGIETNLKIVHDSLIFWGYVLKKITEHDFWRKMKRSMKKLDLFDESDQEDQVSFKTNKIYAKHYDEFRKKELLSHCK